jgi:tRNA A37 methylthiotransferase MiaB
LADHLHLPLQSGSDSILARMGRGYTVAEYLTRVEKLRRVRPNLAITTDLLVGFPGKARRIFTKHWRCSTKYAIRTPLAFAIPFVLEPRPPACRTMCRKKKKSPA